MRGDLSWAIILAIGRRRRSGTPRLRFMFAMSFIKRLRDEIAFASPAELSAQIARDVEETKRALP